MSLSNVFSVDLVGVNFEKTVEDLTSGVVGVYEPGTSATDNLGGKWVFAKANEAIAAYQLCKVSSAAVPLAEPVAAGDIDAIVPILCIPQVAIASGSYGWFWRGPGGGVGRGIKVLAATDCAANKLLFATAVDGVVHDAVVTDDAIAGLFICATITTAAAAEVYATTIISANHDEGVA